MLKNEKYNSQGTIFGSNTGSKKTSKNISNKRDVPPKLSHSKYIKVQSEHYRRLIIGSLVFFVICFVIGTLWSMALDASISDPDSRGLAGAFGPSMFIGIPAIVSLIVAMVAWVSQVNLSRIGNINNVSVKNISVKAARVTKATSPTIHSGSDIIFQSLNILIELIVFYVLYESFKSAQVYDDFIEEISDFSWSGLPIMIALFITVTTIILLKFSPKLKFFYFAVMFIAMLNLVNPAIAMSLALIASIISTRKAVAR